MSRRLQRDAIVVGGGVVGAACALALADAGLQVALVEAGQPARWSREHPDLRVFAFAPDKRRAAGFARRVERHPRHARAAVSAYARVGCRWRW